MKSIVLLTAMVLLAVLLIMYFLTKTVNRLINLWELLKLRKIYKRDITKYTSNIIYNKSTNKLETDQSIKLPF